ncbi:hypothetical protein M413DRAFT_440896 [Hebeloma cylindrosporum]|uniref:Uncharacterized protein n=1 Tax=Hebeloma cylindrosporum TaxID=76867 RepID=A0A0C3CAJ4_HEBCY|nr:hypothetical protein M413DRAFT_440896 [Hebeloma cylindrosporum h7]
MPRPRERSASLEIVPPSNTRGLADVMAAAFNANHQENEASDSRMDEEEDADAEADEMEDELAPEHPNKEPATRAPPPKTPKRCERCVRTNKPCGGTFGQRCDNCKRLKQRCSNSVGGPVRGKGYLSANKKNAASADQSKHGEANSNAGPSTAPKSGLKRKGTPAVNGDVDGHSADGDGSIDEESGPQSGRQRKKRRVSNGLTSAQLSKAVNDMSAAMQRIKASVGKELDKMQGVIDTLNAKIRDMDEA